MLLQRTQKVPKQRERRRGLGILRAEGSACFGAEPEKLGRPPRGGPSQSLGQGGLDRITVGS